MGNERWCSNFSLRLDCPVLCIDGVETNHIDAKEKFTYQQAKA